MKGKGAPYLSIAPTILTSVGSSRAFRFFFDNIPAIVKVLQLGVLIYMLATHSLNKTPPEMPYDWKGPFASVLLGLLLLLYNVSKRRKGLLPKNVLLANTLWLFVTVALLGLSIAFPERECCCPEGKVPRGTCSR